jgi:hypothetical protein
MHEYKWSECFVANPLIVTSNKNVLQLS